MKINKARSIPDYTKGQRQHIPLRRRLFREYLRSKNWREFCDNHGGINTYYAHEFVINGEVPVNEKACHALGLRVVCHACGRPTRKPSVKAKVKQAEPWQRWWWSLSPAKRDKIEREQWEKLTSS